MTKAPNFEVNFDVYTGWPLDEAIKQIMNDLIQHYNVHIVMEHNKG